jgi:capsular polysaccharide biosynthesis protein
VNVREILPRLIRRFGLVLLLTVLGGIAGAVYGAVKTPTYTAKAYVVAIGNAADPNTALNFAQAYGRVATTGPVLAKAGALLGGTDGLDRVTASTSPDAPVIEIDATGPSAQHTAAVANAVGNALSDYGSDRKADTHVSLDLLAGATTPDKPSSPKPPLELLVGAAGGLLIGGLAVLAGAGRPDNREAVDAGPGLEHYTAEVPRPDLEGPAEIEGHLEIWRGQYGQQAITSYRSAAASAPREPETPEHNEAPADNEPPADNAVEEPDADVPPAEPESRPVNGAVYTGPVVGRATVAGMEDDD